MEAKNLDIYGSEPLAWGRVLEQLEAGDFKSCWLATTLPDGRPHVAAVGALWVDGKFYFTSGPSTRKSRNIAKSHACAFAVNLPNADLVVEGTAVKVSDPATLTRLAKLYAAQGWPAEARDGAIAAPFSAPSAGPGPWDLYEFTPVTATAVATAEPHGATRWTLS